MFVRPWLIWTAGFLAFPIAGLAGTAVAGRVDSPAAALTAGLAVGAVIGAAQTLTSSGRLGHRRWIIATALGMGLGLLVGAVAVDFGTSLLELAVMGAVTGLVLGGAQALALPSRARTRWVWAAALPALWALGWTVTTVIGYEVDKQVPVFGASGAVTFAALSGVLLHALLPTGPPATARPFPRTRMETHA
jgi:MFS family permease